LAIFQLWERGGLQRISQNQVISGAWTPNFYGYDGFGSVRQLTNLSGTVTDTYEYDAFGVTLSRTGRFFSLAPVHRQSSKEPKSIAQSVTVAETPVIY
jgi:hypothetical protein